MSISSSQSSRHSSASNEHYTPKAIIEAARRVMGDIDLDPATTKAANWRVRAAEYFTKEQNGFARTWEAGSVFLNPPGGWMDGDGREIIKASASHGGACTATGACGLKPGHTHTGCFSSQKSWWGKLACEWQLGNVEQAIFVCFSIELLQSTQSEGHGSSKCPILPLWFPICFPKTRVAYLDANGDPQGSPPHASCIIYLPPGRRFDPLDVHPGRRFEKIFGEIGECTLSSKWVRFREERLAKTQGARP